MNKRRFLLKIEWDEPLSGSEGVISERKFLGDAEIIGVGTLSLRFPGFGAYVTEISFIAWGLIWRQAHTYAHTLSGDTHSLAR
jgi:hypothetical protein